MSEEVRKRNIETGQGEAENVSFYLYNTFVNKISVLIVNHLVLFHE